MAATEDDELDYHVTFPPAISSGVAKEPVVMLLGWLGCVDKHLMKYSAIYQSKGYTTIRFTAPTSMVTFNTDSARDTARKLLELLWDLGLEENQIVLHVFSNGGGFLLRHIMELITNGENADFARLNVVGSIFDSAPAEAHPLNAISGIYNSSDRLTLQTVIAIVLFVVLGLISFLLPSRYFSNFGLSTYVKSIKESPMKSPQLFLYSTKDKITDYRTVEGVIAERQAAGVEVWQKCWKDSDHVSHFRVHREEYIDKVTQFVQFCLGQQED